MTYAYDTFSRNTSIYKFTNVYFFKIISDMVKQMQIDVKLTSKYKMCMGMKK